MLKYDLYLDETGEFKDNTLRWGFNPSAVGGLLCRSDMISEKKLIAMVKEEYIHGCEHYDKKAYLGYLQEMKRLGGKFVLFENKERIFVIDADVTYLNIITEGLVRLFGELKQDHPGEDIDLRVVVALRTDTVELEKSKNVTKRWIRDDEYHDRLEEKLIIALGKAEMEHVHYEIVFQMQRDTSL